IVYVPVLMLTGIEGKLFRPMAGTVLFALAGAFVLSLTLIPVLASLFVRADFVPTLDEGSILLEARRLPGTALTTSIETDLRLERALRAIPEVRQVVSRIGAPEIANDP